jgi:hypothetical protein
MEGGQAMSEPSFDPAVLALLQEIAKDPRASLLRIPKEPLLKYVGRPEEFVSPHGSYLTKAEKHLVTAYREQGARVLLEACILRLKEDPLIYATRSPVETELRARSRRLAPHVPGEDQPLEALRALAQGKDSPMSALAAGSLRLAPSELAYNVLALAHQQEGHVRASMRVLRRLIDGVSSFEQRAQAWENLARAHVMCKQFKEGFDCNRRASLIDERKIRFEVMCLTNAIQGGAESAAFDSAARLDAHANGKMLKEVVQSLRLGRARGAWIPTGAALLLIPRIHGHVSERSREVCATFS